MILVVALTLIIAALINLLFLRRKQERLHVFSQVVSKKNSLFALFENRANEENVSIWNQAKRSLWNKMQRTYFLLSDESLGLSKLKLIGLLVLGIIAGIILNYFYLNLSAQVVLPVSFFVTLFILIFIQRRRLNKQFYDTFPEALSIMIGVVTSGSSISIGFSECATKIEGSVGATMKEISTRLDLGENANNVFLTSYQKLPFLEYYFFILTIMVNLEGGGELKDILTRLSKMLANNRILVKTRDSKTAELRMTTIILAVIPFAFILMLRVISKDNYDYLIEDPVGNMILYYVIGSVTIGILFIKKMISKVV